MAAPMTFSLFGDGLTQRSVVTAMQPEGQLPVPMQATLGQVQMGSTQPLSFSGVPLPAGWQEVPVQPVLLTAAGSSNSLATKLLTSTAILDGMLPGSAVSSHLYAPSPLGTPQQQSPGQLCMQAVLQPSYGLAQGGISMHQPMQQQHQQLMGSTVLVPVQQQMDAGHTVYFAGAAHTATAESILGVFAQFGRVMNINLFRSYRGAKASKGCGLVEFAQHSEAAAALQTLSGRYIWPGTRCVMTLEWYLPAKHDVFAIEQAPPANRQGTPGTHQCSTLEAAIQQQQQRQQQRRQQQQQLLGSPAVMYSTTWQL